jgi:hypothetical protein
LIEFTLEKEKEKKTNLISRKNTGLVGGVFFQLCDIKKLARLFRKLEKKKSQIYSFKEKFQQISQ